MTNAHVVASAAVANQLMKKPIMTMTMLSFTSTFATLVSNVASLVSLLTALAFQFKSISTTASLRHQVAW